jgi:hypothetical protein
MSWPQAQDYQEAVQNPQQVFADPELQQAEVVCNKLGLPAPYSGSAAVVYHLHTPDGRRQWVVKCFTRPIRDLHVRNSQISDWVGLLIPCKTTVSGRATQEGYAVPACFCLWGKTIHHGPRCPCRNLEGCIKRQPVSVVINRLLGEQHAMRMSTLFASEEVIVTTPSSPTGSSPREWPLWGPS